MTRSNLLPLIAAITLLTVACSTSDASEDAYTTDDPDLSLSESQDNDTWLSENGENKDIPEFDEDAAREEAEDDIAGQSYQEIGMPYGCTDDCSGHEAGFAWRRDHGYAVPGKSTSFEEGGRAFDEAVDDRVDEMQQEFEDEHNQ